MEKKLSLGFISCHYLSFSRFFFFCLLVAGWSWKPTIPFWEKEFCSSVCRIPWRKICEAKTVMSFYKNIAEWNDSAGEEALQNAKARFWAEINGLPCDIPVPDPNIYIDVVNWNSDIDPELLLDLDRKPPVLDDGEKDGKVGILDSTFSNQPIICTGWGDTEDPVLEANEAVGSRCQNYSRIADDSNGWGHIEENKVAEGNSWESGWGDCNNQSNNTSNAWESAARENRIAVNNSWNNGWGHSDEENKVAEGNSWESGWGDCNKKSSNSNNAWESGAMENRIAVNNSWNNGWGQWDNYYRSADNSDVKGRYARYQDNTSRSNGDYCQTNGGWRNGKGRKRASFIHERPTINKRSLAPWQWNSIQSCGPMYQDKSTQSGNPCNWEKPVS